MNTNINTKKQKLRKAILTKLKLQEEKERIKKSREIQKKLFDLAVFQQAKLIMFYVSTNFEVDTTEMIKEAFNLGKTIAVPVICNDKSSMTISLISRMHPELETGPYGIKQPRHQHVRPISKDRLDLVVVPGLAFDSDGHRLGRGKGYYDKFLEDRSDRTRTAGLAFDFQIVEDLPHSLHDQSVEQIITA